MTALRPALVACALAASPAAQAQLFKCVGKEGKVTYQAEKCADAARQSTVRPPDPVPARAAPAEAAEAAEAPKAAGAPGAPAEPPIEWDTFIAQVSSFENCAAVVPGFGVKHKPGFDRWKERYRASFAKFSQDGPAQRRVRESTEYVRGRMNSRSAEERAYDTENCEKRVAAVFAPTNPATSTPTKN